MTVPDRVWAELDAAYEALEREQLDDAKARLDALIAEAPDVPEVSFVRGQLETVRQDPRAALAELTRAVELDPDYADAHYALAQAARATGDEAVYERGYRYLEDEDAPTTTSTTTSVPVTTTLGAPPAPSTTTTGPTGDPEPEPAGGGLDDWLDGVLVTPEGLTLAPVAPDDPIGLISVESWVGQLCDEPICPGWVLEQ